MAEYTIMIYANGNNELEPENLKILNDITSLYYSDNINIVILLSKQLRFLTKILRPYSHLPDIDADWYGANIYSFKNGICTLMCNLGFVNMCESATLINFIEYCAREFSSQKYILYLGGHGFQLIGCMTDLCATPPCMMGIAQLSGAITKACQYLDIKIELLIADTCYFNYVEVLFELAQGGAIVRVLTYVTQGPLYGMPLNTFVKILDEVQDMEQTLHIYIKKSNLNLIAYKLDISTLLKIKDLYNEMTVAYLAQSECQPIPTAMLYDNHYTVLIKQICGLSFHLIISLHNNSSFQLLNIASEVIESSSLSKLYHSLSFTKNNQYTRLITKVYTSETIDLHKPLKLTETTIATIIGFENPCNNKEQSLAMYVDYCHHLIKSH